MGADLPYPILDADFLNSFNLLVTVGKQRLVDDSAAMSIPACASSNALLSPSFFITVAAGNQFHSLLAAFLKLVDPAFKSVKVIHSIHHHIKTSATSRLGQAQGG